MKNKHAIDEICDERAMGNGWFVYLKPGWHYNGQHCFGEDRQRDIAKTMAFVKPCDCDECRALIERSQKLADHKWEQGSFGVCKRCGTDPAIALPRNQHPK